MSEVVAACLHNAVVLIVFGLLAYVFHKWWIVLFSALFILSIHSRKKYDE